MRDHDEMKYCRRDDSHNEDRSVHDQMIVKPVSPIILFVFLLAISASEAQGPMKLPKPPSSVPTSVETGSSQRPSAAVPSISLEPTTTFQPTNFEGDSAGDFTSSLSPTTEECGNDPNFFGEFWDFENCHWNHLLNLTCDDDRVGCHDYGNFGPVANYCCKCKYRCKEVCNDATGSLVASPDYDFSNCGNHDPKYGGYIRWGDDYDDGDNEGAPTILILVCVFFGVVIWTCIVYYKCGGRPDRNAVQQTMSVRRRQQRQNNIQGLTEEERNNARYEIFVNKFYFQTVLPDKSNINVNSLRSPTFKHDEEHTHNDDEQASVDAGGQTSSLSDRLSSWRKPSAKDECCICLECYSEGETICAPMETECNHVFHEGCILEWLKTKDRCPLCRVELLKD